MVALLTANAVHGIYSYSLRRDGCPNPAITYTLMDFVTASVSVSLILAFHTAYMGLGSLALHDSRMSLSLSVPMRFINYTSWPLSNKSKILFLSSAPERDSGCPALTGEADYSVTFIVTRVPPYNSSAALRIRSPSPLSEMKFNALRTVSGATPKSLQIICFLP